MQDVPRDGVDQLERLYFNVDHVTVKGVGNSFQQSNGNQQKFEREMTVCEMSDVVTRAWQSYTSSRQVFEQSVMQAQATRVKLSKSVLQTPLMTPPKFTLGRFYCDLTRKLGVPAAGAQEPNDRPRDTTTTSSLTPTTTAAPTTRPSHDTVSNTTHSDSAAGRTSTKKDTSVHDASVHDASVHDTSTAHDSARTRRDSAATRNAQHDTTRRGAAARILPQTPSKPSITNRQRPGQLPAVPQPSPSAAGTVKPGATPRGTVPGRPSTPPRPGATAVLPPTPVVPPGVATQPNAVIRTVPPPGAKPNSHAPVPPGARPHLPPGLRPPEMDGMTPSIIAMQQSSMNESLDTVAKYDIEIHKKFALAVACFVFVLLGAPIALKFPRGGVGLTIGVSLFVFALYYVGLIAGASLAEKRIIPAWISMWAANVLFSAVALYLLSGMGKEGSTARGGDAGELWDSIKTTVLRWVRPSALKRGEAA